LKSTGRLSGGTLDLIAHVFHILTEAVDGAAARSEEDEQSGAEEEYQDPTGFHFHHFHGSD